MKSYKLITKTHDYAIKSIESNSSNIDNTKNTYLLNYKTVENIDEIVKTLIEQYILSHDKRSIIGATNFDLADELNADMKLILLVFKQKIQEDDKVPNKAIVIEYDDFMQKEGAYLAYYNLREFINKIYGEVKIFFIKAYPELIDQKFEKHTEELKLNMIKVFEVQLLQTLVRTKEHGTQLVVIEHKTEFNVNDLINLQKEDKSENKIYIYIDYDTSNINYDI
jgi:hypothetical protein